MRPRIDELEAIVRRRICAVCEFRNVEEACSCDVGAGGPGQAGHCPLVELFPLVAQAILATETGKLEDYRQAVNENVCSVCIDQALDGTCHRRGLRCALDTYLLPIAEAIEEATGHTFDRGSLARAN